MLILEIKVLPITLSRYCAGAQGEIWTHGVSGLQSDALGRSATCALNDKYRCRADQRHILNLVPHDRIELPSSDYKTDVLPFN